MKTKLIEYHRDKVCNYQRLAFAKHEIRSDVLDRYKERYEFHERAVAWLESLIEDEEGMKIAAQIKNPINEREPKVYAKP